MSLNLSQKKRLELFELGWITVFIVISVAEVKFVSLFLSLHGWATDGESVT